MPGERRTRYVEAVGFEQAAEILKKWMAADGQPHMVAHPRYRNHPLSMAILRMEHQAADFWERDAARTRA